MITLTNITKKYGRAVALNNINLNLERGKIYGLIGPNGSGKSTTLKIIAGLVKPTTGTVTVNGIVSDRKICRYVAYLTELDYYYSTFTVKDTIDFAASQFADFDVQRATELLQFMNLDSSRRVKQLSKGNRGRLKLITALARNTDVILLDEPFSGLDPLVRDSIVESLISYIDYKNQTVIIATHEIKEIEQLLDEVIVINNGQIVTQKDVEKLRAEEGLSILDLLKKSLR